MHLRMLFLFLWHGKNEMFLLAFTPKVEFPFNDIASTVHIYVQNKRELTSTVVLCRPSCSSKQRTSRSVNSSSAYSPPPPNATWSFTATVPQANSRALAFRKKKWKIPWGRDKGTGQMPRPGLIVFNLTINDIKI